MVKNKRKLIARRETFSAVSAIVFDLQEKGTLVAPHIVEHIGDEIASDGNQSDEVTLARRFARLDALVHLLVLGNALAEMLSHIDSSIAAVGRALLGDALGVEEGSARDMLGGGEAEEADHVVTIGEAVGRADLAYQGQGVADPGAGSLFEQSCLRAILDEAVPRLDEVGFARLGGEDVIDEMESALADDVAADGTGEGLAAEGNEAIGISKGKGRARMSLQDGGDGFGVGSAELVREEIVLKKGINGTMVELGVWENVVESRVVGAEQSTELSFLAADLLGQVAGSAGAETGREQVLILHQHDFWSGAQADLLGQSVGVDQFVAYLLGEDLGHVAR